MTAPLLDNPPTPAADLWASFGADLPPALVSDAARARIAAFLQQAPLAANILYLECRLDGGERVDVSFDVPRAEHRRLVPHDGWDGPDAGHVGLEYDLDDAGGDALPATFWPLYRPAQELAALATQLKGLADATAVQAALAHVAAQPAQARVDYVAAMPARQPRPLRLNLSHVPLQRCSGEPVPAVIAQAARHAQHCTLALDFGAQGLLPRWGVELFLAPDADPVLWHPLFDTLAACALAQRGKLQALLHWPGRRRRDDTPAFGSFLGLGRFDARTLSHVKLVVDADGTVAAKAYLAAMRGWQPLAGRGP